jgi:hypothetical protein
MNVAEGIKAEAALKMPSRLATVLVLDDGGRVAGTSWVSGEGGPRTKG